MEGRPGDSRGDDEVTTRTDAERAARSPTAATLQGAAANSFDTAAVPARVA